MSYPNKLRSANHEAKVKRDNNYMCVSEQRNNK
jgi:hypothetical protein